MERATTNPADRSVILLNSAFQLSSETLINLNKMKNKRNYFSLVRQRIKSAHTVK